MFTVILKNDELQKTFFKLANEFLRDQETITTSKMYIREFLADEQSKQIVITLLNDPEFNQVLLSLSYGWFCSFSNIFADVTPSSKLSI